jgi:hypothetical protein
VKKVRQQDLNLGITTYVNGTPMNPVQIDTSTAATDTIDYVATDQSGLTSTTTRTAIIEAVPSIISPDASRARHRFEALWRTERPRKRGRRRLNSIAAGEINEQTTARRRPAWHGLCESRREAAQSPLRHCPR